MNSENVLQGGLHGKNPFDAMYRNVFKYVPSQYITGAQPQSKTAHNIAIVPSSAYASGNLSVFQQALPGGLASGDRSGLVGSLDGSFLDNALSVGVKGAYLNTVGEYNFLDRDNDPVNRKGSVDFLEAAFGASVDIAKFVPVVGPSLIIGGSYGMYNREHGSWAYDNTLISAELNYAFHRRFGLLLGYQQLTMCTEFNGNAAAAEYNFTNFAAGIQYKVADGGALTAKFNRVGGERAEFDGERKFSYKAVQPELFLTVTF